MNPSDLRTAILLIAERSAPLPNNPESVEQQGRWLLALWHAHQLSDGFTIKDIAHMFLGGIQPITSVLAECEDFCGDEDIDTGELLDFLALL